LALERRGHSGPENLVGAPGRRDAAGHGITAALCEQPFLQLWGDLFFDGISQNQRPGPCGSGPSKTRKARLRNQRKTDPDRVVGRVQVDRRIAGTGKDLIRTRCTRFACDDSKPFRVGRGNLIKIYGIRDFLV
jgi:hypothetical protein